MHTLSLCADVHDIQGSTDWTRIHAMYTQTVCVDAHKTHKTYRLHQMDKNLCNVYMVCVCRCTHDIGAPQAGPEFVQCTYV